MNGENKENKTQEQKFRLDDEARRKIDREFSDPDYSGAYSRKRADNRQPQAHRQRTDTQKTKSKNNAHKKGVAEGRKILKKQKKPVNQQPADDVEIAEENPPKKHRLRKAIIITVIICVIVLIVDISIMLYTGVIWFNEPKKRDYPVRGPVLTEDLGEIRWNRFPKQNIQMAYIRATKSTTYVDKRFDYNWQQSASTTLPVGALHIFDPDTDGKKQAQHYSETVGDLSGRLVPAVDIRLTGMHKVLHGDYDKITEKLVNFVEEIENTYGVRPLICCDKKTYKNIVCNENVYTRKKSSNFEGCPIWYESLTSKPDEDVNWTFWCFTDRAKYSYCEETEYMEVVLYRGSEEQFEKYIIHGVDDEQ